jgi:hypothetical protein
MNSRIYPKYAFDKQANLLLQRMKILNQVLYRKNKIKNIFKYEN